MRRAFRTSATRDQEFLDGIWDLVIDADDVGVSLEWYAEFPAETIQAAVPGVWNTVRGYLNYEGIAWYHRRFRSAGGPTSVRFGAVAHQANVWLDGEPLGDHYGGWLPFSFGPLNLVAGDHELVVRVDNTHDMTTTIPSAHLDWHRYGGIPRSVLLERIAGPGYISSFRILSVVDGGQATLRVRAELVNLETGLLNDDWRFYVDDQLLRTERVTLDTEGSQVLLFAVDVPDVNLWSPGDPCLYEVRLEFAGDDVRERTGFRELRVEGDQVLLSDEELRIQGVNRHEDHPDWGPAMPAHLLLRDLDLLSDLGANALRGAHYPNDPLMLDLCDERGVLVMEEIPLWGFSREQLNLDIVADRANAMVWAMVERDVSHPSVWAWSVLNECATDTSAGYAVVEHLVEVVRSTDPTRPVTFASNHGAADICFDLVDLVCVNCYQGWYRHDQSWGDYLREVRRAIGNKPLIISEFGAGAIPGWRSSDEGVVWSEEHQRDIVLGALATLMARDDLTGFYIWQFFDTRTDVGQRALVRPRGYNNKGLLDEYRRPKLAYHAVRELLRSGKE